MHIVEERTNVPRPIQRPSDVELHPVDFGIEPPPPTPPKPQATIIKSAIECEFEIVSETTETKSETINPETDVANSEEETWGEGIL